MPINEGSRRELKVMPEVQKLIVNTYCSWKLYTDEKGAGTAKNRLTLAMNGHYWLGKEIMSQGDGLVIFKVTS